MLRIAVVGLGCTFESYIEKIEKYYEVICVSDSYYSDTECIYNGYEYIPINKLYSVMLDKILICVSQAKYYWRIHRNLLMYGIDESMIMDCLSLWELDFLSERDGLGDRINRFIEIKKEYIKKTDSHYQFKLDDDYICPMLFEYDKEASKVERFYWYFEDWCSKRVFQNKPSVHYDIGGRMEGFINRLLTYGQEVIEIDIRPMSFKTEGLTFIQDDAILLESIPDSSVESISCLGVIESYGLGRWGDNINPDAWRQGLRSINRVTKKGGVVYIAVPIGKEKLEFNGRYVFCPETIVNNMDHMRLVDFSIADPRFGLIKQADLGSYNNWDGDAQIMGCFMFVKEID